MCLRLLLTATLAALLPACIHVEIFHPDVEGTYHLGADRPFWSFDGPACHITTPPITPSAQETSDWCWAAAGQMLLRSQGIEISQGQIVQRAYGDIRLVGGKEPLIQKALTGTFHRSDGSPLCITAHCADGFPKNGLELLSSIEEGRPFIVDVSYAKDGHIYTAHSLLAYGLTYQRTGNAITILSLDTLDPSFRFMRQADPNYDPHQLLPASEFHTIQATLGIYDTAP